MMTDIEKRCARCMEDGLNDDEYCEYYGEPDGCNAPTRGEHPSIKNSELNKKFADALTKLVISNEKAYERLVEYSWKDTEKKSYRKTDKVLKEMKIALNNFNSIIMGDKDGKH